MKLSENQIGEYLNDLEQWERQEEKWIARKYRFSAFSDSIEFVSRIAAIAEQFNHHPLIAIDYRLVSLRLTTWKDGGLTDLDFKSAKAYDQIYAGKEK